MSNLEAIFYIVTPSYNQAQFLCETIESVLIQKSDRIHVKYIVMDGKSTDESATVLEFFGNQIEWKSEKDAGQTDAINKGMRELRKTANSLKTNQTPSKHQKSNEPLQIFAYINSDDFYLPNAFSQVVKAFQENPGRKWVVGDALIIDTSGHQIQKPIQLYKRIFRFFLPVGILSILNPIPQPSTFIKMEVIDEIGEFNQQLQYTMDYEYWLKLFQKFGSPYLISQALSAFRIHGLSKGGSQFQLQFKEELKVARRFTSNLILISLHSLHNQLILFIYRLLK